MCSVYSYLSCLPSPASYELDSGSPRIRATALKKGTWETEHKEEIEIWFKERFCLSDYGLSKQLVCPDCWPPRQAAALYPESLLLDRNPSPLCLTVRYAKLRLTVPWSQLRQLFPSASIFFPNPSLIVHSSCPLHITTVLLTHSTLPETYKEQPDVPDAGLNILQDSTFVRI